LIKVTENKMKTKLLAVVVLWVGAAVAQAPDSSPSGGAPAADGGPPPGFRHESAAERLDHLAVLLDLTDAQKAQVGTILEEEHAKMKEAHDQAKASGTRPTPEQMKAEHQQMQQDTLAKLTPVLTPAQLKKFQVLMQEHGRPEMGARPQTGGPPGGPH
jgi:Spy/CpxP family protein refolding chaperone